MSEKYGSVSLELDNGAIEAVIGGYARQASYKAAHAFIEKAKQGIMALGRIQTGEMYDGWEIREEGRPLEPEITVYATAPHTIFQELGTRGSQARPGRKLRFSVGGRIVFATKTGPIKAGNFMATAIQSISVADFGEF